MKTIYRYHVNFIRQPVLVPGFRKDGELVPFKEQVIKVDVIRGMPSIWCLVDTDENDIERNISVVGTGWSVKDTDGKENYLGSFIYEDSEIYHLFAQ